ncbi:MAG: hypothetical protein LBG88_02235 [Christensenellaceae bacterium]|jgi:hypothetical protein|nr:hypothetical protein [Christensenellaceae bacterium]
MKKLFQSLAVCAMVVLVAVGVAGCGLFSDPHFHNAGKRYFQTLGHIPSFRVDYADGKIEIKIGDTLKIKLNDNDIRTWTKKTNKPIPSRLYEACSSFQSYKTKYRYDGDLTYLGREAQRYVRISADWGSETEYIIDKEYGVILFDGITFGVESFDF